MLINVIFMSVIAVVLLQSLSVRAPRTNALIRNLVGFSRYHFYLLVRYAEENTDTYGIYSEATQRTVRTIVSGKLCRSKNCENRKSP